MCFRAFAARATRASMLARAKPQHTRKPNAQVTHTKSHEHSNMLFALLDVVNCWICDFICNPCVHLAPAAPTRNESKLLQ